MCQLCTKDFTSYSLLLLLYNFILCIKEGHLNLTLCLRFESKTEIHLNSYMALLHAIIKSNAEVREVLVQHLKES